MIDYQNITVTGANITTGVASASIAIPFASSGKIPQYVRVSTTAAAHVRIGTSGVTAVVTDTLVNPNGGHITLMIPRGITHIAAIQNAAAGSVNVVPLEDC